MDGYISKPINREELIERIELLAATARDRGDSRGRRAAANNMLTSATGPAFRPDPPRRVVAATLVVAAVIAGFGVAYLLSDVLFLLFVGVVLATALEPIIEVFQRRRVPRLLAVGGVYACGTLVLVVVIAIGCPYVIHQVQGLLNELSRANQQAHQWLARAGDVLWARVARRIMDEVLSGKGPAELEPAWPPSARRPRISRSRFADSW